MKEPCRPFAFLAALLALRACSPAADAPPPEEPRQQTAPANARQPVDPAGNVTATAAGRVEPAGGPARRCGWLHNPTPANWWLVDRDGQWILGSQGADQAEGMHEMPDMSGGEWVEVNGHYGYGCACMTLTADPATGRVLRVSDAAPKPLAQCRADRQLPNPDAG